MGISEFLSENGFICWILEWRNHGDSSRIKGAYNFEKIGKEDVQRAFDYLFYELELPIIDCVTHSGGGISVNINLVENPSNRNRIKRMVLVGCQSFGACHNWQNYSKVYVAKLINKVVGFAPARLLGRPENENYSFMKQWYDWNLAHKFVGDDGKTNYALEFRDINIPILAIGGAGDTFIAPKSGCEQFLSCFKNPINRFLYCGKETGYAEDYSHSRIIYSQNAIVEIYPTILDWINTT